MSISTTVKAIQDIMRKDAGVDGDAQRISQMVWMIFLKIFDDREAEWEIMEDDYKSPIPEALRWRNWAADSEGITGDTLLDFVDNALFKTLKTLSLASGIDRRGYVVRAVFEDAYNYMKNGTLIRQVINKLNEIDFNNSQDRHLFGDIYEKILRDLQSAGNAGEFYTPRAVTQFMVDMLDPELGEKVLDPAWGTGGFLVCALEHIRNNYVKTAEDEQKLHQCIMGVEKKSLPHLLCVTNLLLHGVDIPAIRHDNILTRPLRDYKPSDKVNVIITNPPFGGEEEDGIETNFPASIRSKETADLFLILITHLIEDSIDSLKKQGRGGIVLPDGTLFGENQKKSRLKEKLLEECNLHTIVRLPNGVFKPYTGIKTNLLFFTKGEPTKEIWYYEHPYPPGYKSYNTTKPIRIEEFEVEKAWWYNREENEFAWKVSVEDIKNNGYNLDIKNPHKIDVEHGDLEEMLGEYQQLLDELGETRLTLKQELMAALGGEGV
jgi:type I restriction enzyme M protein